MIEIPPKFAGRPPVNPAAVKRGESSATWKGATGLAEDVRYYGAWMREEAQKRIGHLYPPVEITAEMAEERPDFKPLVGQKLTVIAWLWARTVKSPNPAFSHVDVPLASSFVLCSKPGKEVYAQPIVDEDKYKFTVKMGTPPSNAEEGTKASGRGANFRCLVSETPISGDYIKSEGQAGRLGQRLLALVAEGGGTRVYLDPTTAEEAIAFKAQPNWRPAGDVPIKLTGGTCVPYGMKQWGDLFTSRQLLALTTFSELLGEARKLIERVAIEAGLSKDSEMLEFYAGATQHGRGCWASSRQPNLRLLTFRIEPELKEAVRAASVNEHRSIANMIAVMIRAYCGRVGIEIAEPNNAPQKNQPRAKAARSSTTAK